MGKAAREWAVSHFDLSVSRAPNLQFGMNASMADSAGGYSEIEHRL
jgi:hypothetical protein